MKRSASIRAAVDTDLCILTKEDFMRILATYPTVKEKILRSIEERKANDVKRKLEEERKRQEEAQRKEAEQQRTAVV